jgi:DNA-binding response OmpR family regulator
VSSDVQPQGLIFGENDPLMRGIVRSVLLQTGHNVFLAADGMEAISLARRLQARLVLLDIGMPRLNGMLACQAIRKLPGYTDVPIVMLTGYDDTRMRQAARLVGADDFITKPFRPDQLLARLMVHLDTPAPARAAALTALGRGPECPGSHVWNTIQPTIAGGDSPELLSGREMLLVLRDAEGHS